MSRPLRVLHIIDSLHGGGVERWLWDTVRLSDRSQVVHRVVTVASETHEWKYADALHRVGAYTRCPRRLTQAGRFAERLLEVMPDSCKERLWSSLGSYDGPTAFAHGYGRIALAYLDFRPDLIHGHLFHGLRAGAWLKRWTTRPFVYSVWNRVAQLHDAGAGWVADDYLRLHQVVDAFLTDPAYRVELIAHGLPSEKIFTFDGALDIARVDRFMAARAKHRVAIRRRLGIPLDAPIALSVGRLTRSKGHEHAINAMPAILRRVPDLHWILLGEGEDRASLTALAAAAGVGTSVRMPGFVSEPYEYYAAADIFMRTWTIEGENRSSQDAMAFGLPVAGFDTDCVNDCLPTVGHGLRVPNADAVALADAVLRLLLLPDRGRSLGTRGYDHARRHLGADRMLALFNSHYARLSAEAA